MPFRRRKIYKAKVTLGDYLVRILLIVALVAILLGIMIWFFNRAQVSDFMSDQGEGATVW